MLTDLVIEGFKSLQHAEIELGRVNVFIGANASGKSNLLEALGVLGAAASGRVDDESLLYRGVRPGVPALYKASFRGTRSRPFISFSAQWTMGEDNASFQVGLDNPIEDPRPAWRYRFEQVQQSGQSLVSRSPRSTVSYNPEAGLAALEMVKLAPDDPAARLLNALRAYVIYTPTTAALRGLVNDLQLREPVGLSGGRLPEAVSELFRTLTPSRGRTDAHGAYYDAVSEGIADLVDWATDIGSAPSRTMPLSPSVASSPTVLRFRDRYMAEGRNVLTGYDASEGALYVLLNTVLAAHPAVPPVFAVDNFDHGLNPRLARALMASFCAWSLQAPAPRQVLLTTHNPLILDGLDLTDDRVRLFAVDRSSQGQSVVKRVILDERVLARAREGWPLSRLWVMGELGGVPNV